MIKILLYISLNFFFINNLIAHDPKNCDVLQNYDFSGFNDWKEEIVNKSGEFGLDKSFVSKLIAPYEVNKRVIENDKCQPEFTLTFSEYIEKTVQFMGLAFLLYSSMQFISFSYIKLISINTIVPSFIVTLPVIIGFLLGKKISSFISEKLFKKLFYFMLLMMSGIILINAFL